MCYKLKFRERPGYLIAYVRSHEASPEVSTAYMREIRDRCAASNATRLLVIRDVPKVLGTVDFYNVSKDSVELLKGIKTAWVNPYPSLSSTLEFAVTVANNRGATYGLFADVQQAATWLASALHNPQTRVSPVSTVA